MGINHPCAGERLEEVWGCFVLYPGQSNCSEGKMKMIRTGGRNLLGGGN